MTKWIPMIAAAVMLVLTASAMAGHENACKNFPVKRLIEAAEKQGVTMLDLKGAEFDAFDQAMQSLGAPAAPEYLDRVIVLDPDSTQQTDGIIPAPAFDEEGCYIGDARFPLALVAKALELMPRYIP